MKEKLSTVIKLILSLGLGVGLMYWFIGRMPESEKLQTWETMKSANIFWLLSIPLFGFLSNFSRAERWRYLLQSAGYKPGFWNTFFSVMIMYFANLFVPRSGDVLRCSILTKYEGIPVDKSVGTMVVERFVDLISIAVIGFILFVGQREKFLLLFSKKAETAPESPEMTVIKYIVPVLLVLGISGFSFYVWKKHGIEKFVTIVKEKMSGFLHGLQSIRNVKNPMAFIIHSILVWVCYIFMTYFAFRALPETASLDIWACLACLFFGGFAMVATPGGLGVFPITIKFVLLQFGIAASIGLPYGLAVWAMQTLAGFVGGILSIGLLLLINRSNKLVTKLA